MCEEVSIILLYFRVEMIRLSIGRFYKTLIIENESEVKCICFFGYVNENVFIKNLRRMLYVSRNFLASFCVFVIVGF